MRFKPKRKYSPFQFFKRHNILLWIYWAIFLYISVAAVLRTLRITQGPLPGTEDWLLMLAGFGICSYELVRHLQGKQGISLKFGYQLFVLGLLVTFILVRRFSGHTISDSSVLFLFLLILAIAIDGVKQFEAKDDQKRDQSR